jgi:hypothetical protein
MQTALKRPYLAQQTFRDVDHRDRAIQAAVQNLNQEQHTPPCAFVSKTA